MKRMFVVLALAVVGLLAVNAQAQQGGNGPTAEQQEMFQKMQDNFRQMQQNAKDKNIDLGEFFRDIGKQVQDGTLDPADIQKMMVDKGIMDQKMVDDMQATMEKAQTASMKDQLQATDDEWKLLEPKIKKVMAAQAVVNLTQNGGGGGGFGGGGFGGGGMAFAATAAGSDSGKALKALRQTTHDKAADVGKVEEQLKTFRAAHEQAKTDLVTVQKELTEILTVRQEAVLANAGIL